MRVLAHLCTASAAAQPATAEAAPTGTAGAAAVLQDLAWNGLIPKEKPAQLHQEAGVRQAFARQLQLHDFFHLGIHHFLHL